MIRATALGTLLSVTASGLLAQSDQPANAKEDESVKLEAFTVTGSRIKRVDAETPQPVVRLTEADFKATGFTTVGDAIRAMPAVTGQSLVSVDAGTSFTPGVSSFNLRGLGNNNTLVLVNGRRMAPFASAGFNGFQTVFDFNSIPVAAIDSLEVLKDGASAIYGSDAVAGVININLKKEFTGLSSEVSYGNALDTDSGESQVFLIFGAQSGKASLTTTFNYSRRNSIYARDLDYASSANGVPYGGTNQGSTAHPIAIVIGLTPSAQFPNGVATYTTPQTNPTLANATPNFTLYNFQEVAGFIPDTEQMAFYTRATYDFTDKLMGFAELSYSRTNTQIDAAPTPYFAINENGDSPTGAGVFPASNPYNPFGVDIYDLRWRIMELGNRVQDVQTTAPRVVAGLEGSLDNGWTWDAALVYSRNDVRNLGLNYASDRLVQNALNGVTINGQNYWLNPFGPNAPEVINYIRVNNPANDSFEVRSADASVAGNLFSLPAGDVGLAVGAEMREERIENIGTVGNRTGDFVGGSTGDDVRGNRRLNSYYAELSVPVLGKNSPIGAVEAQFAGRHEDYSDFGTTTKPKVAVVWRPIPEVLIRGSYGESFLAPNLAYLYLDRSVSFTPGTIVDPLRPADPATQIRQFGGGNRNLLPEETTVWYGGLVLQPFARQGPKLFRELSFAVDYFKFDQENLITSLTAGQILGNLAAFGHLVVRNAPAPGQTVGTISHVLTNQQNLARGGYEGYDFNLRWVFPRTDYGQFRMDLSATYQVERYFVGATGAYVDLDANYSSPLWRGTATLAWTRGDWSASLYGTYIGEYNMIGTAISGAATRPKADAQWIWNPQVAYSGWAGSTITVGVRNVFNEAPPVSVADSTLVNENLNHVDPLFWYVRWSRNW